MKQTRKCVFFDRDGIVNKPPGPGYVEHWKDFELIPEFTEVLSTVLKRGYDAVIVTNQRGIARGIVKEDNLLEIHLNLKRILKEKYNLELLDILYCPHNNGECKCRKPDHGMLITAAEKHDIDLKKSWMIGDNERDIEAGQRAGCRTILVSHITQTTKADFSVINMKKLVSLIKKLL